MLDLVEEDWKEEIQVGHWTAETVVHLEDEDGDLAFKVAVGDNLTGTQVWGYRENDAKDLAAALRWLAGRLDMAVLHREAEQIVERHHVQWQNREVLGESA